MDTTTRPAFTGTLKRAAKQFAEAAAANGWDLTVTTTGPEDGWGNVPAPIYLTATLPPADHATVAVDGRRGPAWQVDACSTADGTYYSASARYGTKGGTRGLGRPKDAIAELVATRQHLGATAAAATRQLEDEARRTSATALRAAHLAAVAERDHPEHYAWRRIAAAAEAAPPAPVAATPSRSAVRAMGEAIEATILAHLAERTIAIHGRPGAWDGTTASAPLTIGQAAAEVVLAAATDWELASPELAAHTIKAIAELTRWTR